MRFPNIKRLTHSSTKAGLATVPGLQARDSSTAGLQTELLQARLAFGAAALVNCSAPGTGKQDRQQIRGAECSAPPPPLCVSAQLLESRGLFERMSRHSHGDSMRQGPSCLHQAVSGLVPCTASRTCPRPLSHETTTTRQAEVRRGESPALPWPCPLLTPAEGGDSLG